MAMLPTGTVTFLFTDIEGSTRLLESAIDAYRAGLAQHDATIRSVVAKHDGVIVHARGDGFCVAFASPNGGVRAAIECQLALGRADWGVLGALRVRMGLHTGEVELHGDEYFGAPLHRCARLMDSAHGGQVLLTAVTASLVRESLPQGVSLRDLGEHRLRDLAHPERVYELVSPGTEDILRPIRSLSTIPNNLPTHLTEFIGREQQFESLRTTLGQLDVRLLTLTGPGGAGKTRLALRVAAALLDRFADGVYFVPLAAITDPSLVVPAIAQSLDLRETSGRSTHQIVGDWLERKQMLLVLDNFEQVAEAAADVARLLVSAEQVKILVTSRAILRLYGEREFVVPPLTLPDRREAPSAAQLSGFESIRLFVDRARAARPDFSLDDSNAAAVAAICQRLDGLPLAIELAAARIRTFPPNQMLARMERRLPMLTGGSRDLPARQRTLQDAIAWSYDLLNADEQLLFSRLAVFRGFELESAESVCAGAAARPGASSVALQPLQIPVVDGIESLVEKSLLRRGETADGQAWYAMLETVREFASDRLAASGETDAVVRRHILWALDLAERSESEVIGPSQLQWFARIEIEHDNLRSALGWCLARGYAEPALRLTSALWWFWSAHGHVTEGREQVRRVLERFPITERTSAARQELIAQAHYAAGMLASHQGDFEAAHQHHRRGLELRRQLGDRKAVFNSLEGLGTAQCLAGDFDDARETFEEAVIVAVEVRDSLLHMLSLHALGNIASETGDLDTARRYYERTLDVSGANTRHVGTLVSIAALELDAGHPEIADELAQRALRTFQADANHSAAALALAFLGGAALARGNHAEAYDRLRESITIQKNQGNVSGISQVIDRLVELALSQGHVEDAMRLAGAAGALRLRSGGLAMPGARRRQNQPIETARALIGDDAVESAMAQGARWSPDEAVAEALRITAPSDGVALDSRTTGTHDDSPLSPRESEVARLIASGNTNRQIAETLVVGEGTVATHVVHILRKLGFSSRAQIAAWVVERRGHSGLSG